MLPVPTEPNANNTELKYNTHTIKPGKGYLGIPVRNFYFRMNNKKHLDFAKYKSDYLIFFFSVEKHQQWTENQTS